MATAQPHADSTLKPLRTCELRRANDGELYSASEFEAHYGNRWKERWELAEPCVHVSSPPAGLRLGSLHAPELLARTLEEVRPHLERAELEQQQGKSWAPQALEVGLSFYQSDYAGDGSWRAEAKRLRPLAEFPALREVLASAMESLCGGRGPDAGEPRPDMLDSELLNIIVRRYGLGDSITFHRDKVDWFQEEVFGVVLRNTSDRALEFHRSVEDVTCRWVVDEVPGICFRQCGDARFDWSHGVRPIGTGERISATWRWFQAPHSIVAA